MSPTLPATPASARTRPAPTAAPPRVAPWFPLVLALAVAAVTVLLLVEPSQSVEPSLAVSDGDQSRLLVPPEPGPLTLLLGVGAYTAVLLGPLVSMWVAVWAGTWAWLSWEQLRGRDRAFLLVAAAVAVSVVAFDFSPVGRDIARGMID